MANISWYIRFYNCFLWRTKNEIYRRKKANSDAVLSMQTVYENFVKDIESRYADMRDQMQEVRSEVVLLRKENSELRKELRLWEKKYYDLKNRFDETAN